MIGLLSRFFIKDRLNYADAKVRTNYGILTGTVGIVLNFLLFAGKLAAGLITSSVSVIADAFNNLSDAGSSIVSIVGCKIAAMPADSEHPYGHGRAEYAAGLIVAASIVFMALETGKESLSKIFAPEELNAGVLSVVILGASVLVKLYMFAYNRHYGKLIDSEPMRATAVDSLSDCISTLSAAAALIVYLVWGVNIDGWIGLFITFIILKAGVEAARSSLALLLGKKADEDYTARIKETVLAHSEVIGVHDLSVHNYGVNRNIVSLHVELPASMSFSEAHDIADIIENELAAKFSADVTIHMDPVCDDSEQAARYRELALSLIKTVSPDASMHDFRVNERGRRFIVAFDVEVPFGLPLSDDEIRERIERGFSEYDSTLGTSVRIDKI